MRKKWNIENVKSYFEEKGCTLLETVYVNNKVPMRYICECKEESDIAFAEFLVEKRCWECGVKKRADKNRHSFEFVKKFFEDQGCVLLEENYIDNKTKMRYICAKGHHRETRFDKFYSGEGCKICGHERTGLSHKLSCEEVKKTFEKNGCVLLEEKYEGSMIPMVCECSCGRMTKMSYAQAKNGCKCFECGREKRSGPNSPHWNPDRESVKLKRHYGNLCDRTLKRTLIETKQIKTDKMFSLLGYTRAELQDYIQNHENMKSISDKKWHLDHIFPISAFVEYGIKNLSLINSLDNLQPLTAKDNLSKRDKYDQKEFEAYLISKGVSWDLNRVGIH